MKAVLILAILAVAVFGQAMACSSAEGCTGASRQLLESRFFPSGAMLAVFIIPFVLVFAGIIITLSCYCCACCLALRSANRVHEVELITAAPVVISHGSVPAQGYYVGGARQEVYMAAPVMVAAPVHRAPVFVPLVVEDDSFY